MKTTYEILVIWGVMNLLFMLVSYLYNLGDIAYARIAFMFLGGYLIILLVGFYLTHMRSKQTSGGKD